MSRERTHAVSTSTNARPKPIVRPILESLEDRLMPAVMLDSNLAYIQELYQGYLGRDGSVAELQSWQPTLVTSGMAPVVEAFRQSDESHRHTITSFYQEFLGRTPQGAEAAGLIAAMNDGISKEVIASTFLGSSEFYNRAPSLVGVDEAPNDRIYIRALFRTLLDREPGADETNNFLRNVLTRTTRPGTALFIITSPEFRGLMVREYYGASSEGGILERDSAPTAAEVNGWVQSGHRLDDVEAIFMGSLEKYHNTRSPGDSNQLYVDGLYDALLGRAAIQSERDFWEDRLVENGMRGVVNGIQNSVEARGYMVKQWYVSFLGRNANNGEEQGLVSMLNQGVPAESVLGIMIGSPEYFTRSAQVVGARGASSPETYVKSLYQDLVGRTPSASEIDDYTKKLIPARGRQGVAILALNTPEFRQGVIRGYYDDYLGRVGKASEAEVQGWVKSRQTLLTVEAKFLSSLERYQLTVNPGTPLDIETPVI